MIPNQSLCAGMVFGKFEEKQLNRSKLRPFCIATDNKFLARAKIGDQVVTGRKFDTIKECNAYHDKMMGRK